MITVILKLQHWSFNFCSGCISLYLYNLFKVRYMLMGLYHVCRIFWWTGLPVQKRHKRSSVNVPEQKLFKLNLKINSFQPWQTPKKKQANLSCQKKKKSLLERCLQRECTAPAKMHDRKVIITACLHARSHARTWIPVATFAGPTCCWISGSDKQGDSDGRKYSSDDITGPFWPLHFHI